MESPITMGEAGDNVCKEKSKHTTDDGVCVNGDLSCDEPMDICENDNSKALEVSVNNVDSLKNCEEVPENKVPSEEVSDNDNVHELMEVDVSTTDGEEVDEEELEEEEEEEEEHGDIEVKQQDHANDDVKIVEHNDIIESAEISDEDEDDDDDDDDVLEECSKEEEEEDEDESKVVNGTDENSLDGSTTIDLVDSPVKSELSCTTAKSANDKTDDSVELNDSGDVVLVENDSDQQHKENGNASCSSPDVEEVISVSDKDTSITTTPTATGVSSATTTANSSADILNLLTPAKKQKQKKSIDGASHTPRRSTRNLHKQKSYVEKEDDPDVEEVTPEDPLADPLRDDKENSANKPKTKHPMPIAGSTIVVSDTKRLVEIAANSKVSNSSGGKKEPTLVIIDTNSILSGRGPVPVSHKSNTLATSFSMLPVALPAQGVYPPNMRATITPIPMSTSLAASKATSLTASKSSPTVAAAAPVSSIAAAVAAAAVAPSMPTQILPTLTDDMYVVEAPSFIVPYVYEKPPLKPFREFVVQMQKEIEEQKKIEKLKQEQEEKENAMATKDEDVNKDKEDKGEAKSSKKDEPDSSVVDSEKKDIDKKDEKDNDSEEDDDKKSTSKDTMTKDDASADKKDDVVIISSSDKDDNSMKTIDLDEIPDEKVDPIIKPKSNSYFDNALGQFFINIGTGLVQEFVQTDLLKQQKRKQNREGGGLETKQVISSLIKNLEYSKENNEPYKLEQKRCEFCSFKTESDLVLAHHLETPHMRNYVYKCNFCPLEVRSPHDILFHMEAEHNTRGRLERAPAFHQCPNCPFEDNQKGKLSRHLVTCVKKFKPERNLEPPADWEPPAKIPRVPRIKQQGLTATAATYQALAQAKGNYQLFSKLQQATASSQAFSRGRGRPSLMGKVNSVRPQTPIIRTNMMYRPGTSGNSVLVPTSYQFSGNQIFQVVGGQSDLGAGRLSMSGTPSSAPVALVPNLSSTQSTVTIQNSSGAKSNSSKVVQQPSISITPLPRQPASSSSATNLSKSTPGEPSSKATFVICEICDGYIKDLEQLRNHMQWIHKVKIHPKMIYNRPPLNCQKCQFRFFTDQGLERHLLGSHGLVTSSMQEAANKSKDAGRCPVCGRVYQWKLLNHVARDHNMTLKPAHLSYKCTVCTATFGMYKQFENHVYSAHSVVAKRVMDKKSSSSSATSSSTSAGGAGSTSSSATSGRNNNSSHNSESLLKPLKINDEITIIPQPAKSKSTRASAANSGASAAQTGSSSDRGK